MEKLLILCLFPVAWPFIAQRIWHTKINYQEMALQIVLVTVVVAGVWQIGKWGQTVDTEVWNGQVISKQRIHDEYTRSYECNCSESCSGSGSSRSCYTTCDTCYEDHYTVEWLANTTVGKVQFDYKDSTWRSVYNSPDPAVYTNCKKGHPASIEHNYTNYVQAVPESLFNDNSSFAEQFAGKIPAYPRVYGFYKFNRVINVDSSVPQSFVTDLDTQIDNTLKVLGPTKQVNIIVILTEIDDPSYRFAIENAWLGGEKNDVIVMVGLDGNTITWVDIMTWALNSGNELFHVTLRDALTNLKTIDSPDLALTITNIVASKYDRPRMADYEYLADEVEPAGWVIILAIVLAIGGSLGLTFVFHRVDVDFLGKRGYGRRKWNINPFRRPR